MSLREQIREAVASGDQEAVDRIAAADKRALRHLLGLTYKDDAKVRAIACNGLGAAAQHHPKKILEICRQLVWAMNDESGTNALTAPEVLEAVATAAPPLLVPLVPDIIRLTADEGLRAGLSGTLRAIAAGSDGAVARQISDHINAQLRRGGAQ